VHTAAVSGGPTTFTLNPDTDFVNTETCTVTIVAAQVSDQDTDDPLDNMVADYIFSFSTEGPVCSQTFTPIYSIQGSGSAAAITGNVTTQGVVVGDFEGTASASGFYLQDATGDGNSATSDGIFVFTGSSNLVNVGDVVRVTGYARERFNQTALNGSNSNTAAVPAANIVNCGSGSVPPTDVSLPFGSATDPERYEGMYVRFPQSLVIAEYFNYDRFGEIVLALPLDSETRPFTGTAIDEPGAAANARTLANSLSRITLDDAQSAQNPPVLRHPNGNPFSLSNLFRGGDLVQNAVGVLGYDFNLYRIVPTGPADYTAANPRPASPEPVGGTIRVAAMNTLNFFVTLDGIDDDPPATDNPVDNICGGGANLECRGADASQPTEFTRQRDKLLTALSGLDGDIIGLNELENTPGVEPLESITSGMPGYDYIDTGVIGTDAIKVGLIYRPAVVTPVGTFKLLTTAVDPRFIDTKSRPSLAQTFQVNATGAKFTVVVNHFKSKGSACTDVGDPDLNDGQGNCSQTRRAAAEALVDWLATDPTGSGDPDFLIMGDLNSYAMEDSIDEIKAGSDDIAGTSDDFTNLIAHFQGTYAYSYTFDGQAGYLDHALANASLFSQVTGTADWHINSDEPDVLDYDTSFKPSAQEALYEVNQYRTSDHDAVVVGLDLLNMPPVAVGDSYSTNEDTTLTVAAPGVLSNDTDAEHNPLTAALVNGPTHGALTLNADGSFTYTPASNYNGTDSFTYKANDANADSNVATVSITVNAINDAPVAANNAYSTNEDATLSIAAPGVLANDSDVDGNSLTAVLVNGPSHGSLTLNSNGSFNYTPAANYNGSDSFAYKANDGTTDSNVATVTITVNAVNDAPVANPDSATIAKNTSGVIYVLANDSDVEGDTLTVVSFTQPAHGTVAYSSKNKNFRYTPAKGFTGTDTFTYTISDGHGGTATGTVTVTVQ
jgi:VCBS repeat-containing protein